MIPKKIHWCWLSGEKIPRFLVQCMKTWKEQLPDYEFILWDKNRFDINSVPFVLEAVQKKKWAFAADYIRLHAINSEGGIYLDSDVIVKKSFDDILYCDFFAASEYWPESIENHNTLSLINENGTLKQPVLRRMYGLGIQAAIFGGIQGHPFLKDCLSWYNMNHFPPPIVAGTDMPIAPDIYAYIAQNYGYYYKNELQKLKSNMTVFPSSFFPNSVGCNARETYAIHCCEGSWTNKKKTHKIYQSLVRNNFIRKLLGKKSYFDKILYDINYNN
jgi:mannosyltransferase OCH1-like enzyme